MSNNPFKPPRTGSGNEPVAAGSPLRAVLTGLAVDLGCSAFVGMALTFIRHAQLASSGMAPEQVENAMGNLGADSPIAVIGMLLGAACSVAGGYVCARIVRRDEYRVGGVMAALSGLFGLLFEDPGTPGDLLWLLTLTTVACVLLGVKYGRERNLGTGLPAGPSGP